MIKYLSTILTFFLLTVNINAQSNIIVPSDSISTTISPEKNKKGILTILEKMKPNDIFVLREIAGIYPVIRINKSGQRICVWNDNIKITSPAISPVESSCNCTVYKNGDRIGLGFVDKNDDLVKGTTIASWRLLPYIAR